MSTSHMTRVPVSTDSLRATISENWPHLSATAVFYPPPGARIRNAQTLRGYRLELPSGTVLLCQELSPITGPAAAGLSKMVAELREIFGDVPPEAGVTWEEFELFAHLVDVRAFECEGGKKLPKGEEASYTLSEIGQWLAKHRIAVAADKG